MKRITLATLNIRIPLGRTGITLGAGWLVIVPAAAWAIATIYVPILGAYLSPVEAWGLAAAIILLVLVSLVGHAVAHLGAARLSRSSVPANLPLYPLGEAAQVWPAASSAWREVVVAVAGPLVNILLAWLAYLLWNAQLQPYLNLSMLFLAFFNGLAAAINLTPAFPFDGGRLLRAMSWGLLQRPALAARLGMGLGWLLSAGLTVWGIFLIAQQARVSLQSGIVSFVLAGLMLLGLRGRPVWQWDRPVPAARLTLPGAIIRVLIAGLFIFGLLGITFSLAPTNDGLEAPGVAVPVEPMVRVPPEHSFTTRGSFILTSVILQTPITAGEWLYGQMNPIFKIVPPERIVPPGKTAQQVAREEFQMLDESETTAAAVGLRLAGYDVTIAGKGAKVVTLLPDSLARDLLQSGDVITGLNGEPVTTTAELINRLRTLAGQASVHLQIERAGRQMELVVPLMSPAKANEPPRIGITVDSAGFKTRLPFPVEIVPEKIVGGPSAGLMFTLTVYNAVTPEDLTGGRKIAGTGTINPDGTVGPIGGVQQKVTGAEWAGASYFLSPPENYADALAAARQIKVVKVATAEEAIQFLRSLPPLSQESAGR